MAFLLPYEEGHLRWSYCFCPKNECDERLNQTRSQDDWLNCSISVSTGGFLLCPSPLWKDLRSCSVTVLWACLRAFRPKTAARKGESPALDPVLNFGIRKRLPPIIAGRRERSISGDPKR